eukprot:6476555-Amphidinium_carterae.4
MRSPYIVTEPIEENGGKHPIRVEDTTLWGRVVSTHGQWQRFDGHCKHCVLPARAIVGADRAERFSNYAVLSREVARRHRGELDDVAATGLPCARSGASAKQGRGGEDKRQQREARQSRKTQTLRGPCDDVRSCCCDLAVHLPSMVSSQGGLKELELP